MDLLQEVNDLGEKSFIHCLHRDVILVCGSVASGKSVFMNYLYEMPLKEFSSDDLHLKEFSFQKYIDIDTEYHPILHSSDTPRIHHEGQSTASLPFIIKRQEFVLCECPSVEVFHTPHTSLINAVTLRKICQSANTIRVILLVPFQTILEDREISFHVIHDILVRIFNNLDCFKNHSSSVSMCVTNLPQVFPGQISSPSTEVQSRLQSSNSKIFQILANQNLIIFDPLNRRDRLISCTPSIQELINTLKMMKPIRRPSNVLFKVPFPDELSCIQVYGQQLVHDIKTLIEEHKIHEASRLYQRFMDVTVLDNEITTQIIQNVRDTIHQICVQKVDSIEKLMTIHKVNSAEAILRDYAEIVKAFDVTDQMTVLEDLKSKYEKNKILRVASLAGAGMIGCAGVGVGVAASIIFPPFMPLGFAVGAAVGGGVAGTGMAAIFVTSAYKLGRAFGFTSKLQPHSEESKSDD